jgi:hypothetical protein
MCCPGSIFVQLKDTLCIATGVPHPVAFLCTIPGVVRSLSGLLFGDQHCEADACSVGWRPSAQRHQAAAAMLLHVNPACATMEVRLTAFPFTLLIVHTAAMPIATKHSNGPHRFDCSGCRPTTPPHAPPLDREVIDVATNIACATSRRRWIGALPAVTPTHAVALFVYWAAVAVDSSGCFRVSGCNAECQLQHGPRTSPSAIKVCYLCGKIPTKGMQCSRCKKAKYCTAECSKAHWSQHRKGFVAPREEMNRMAASRPIGP